MTARVCPRFSYETTRLDLHFVFGGLNYKLRDEVNSGGHTSLLTLLYPQPASS
jgi:hypothetical protein